MGNILEIAVSNLTSPIVLFFALGLFITLIKAKVEFPGAISDFLSIYLLVAIGFKGGVTLSEAGLGNVISLILGGIFIGVAIPLYSYAILRWLGKIKSDDAAALAGHYGSISVVTFVAASSFLTNIGENYEGYLNGLPAIMEIPAIVVALMLASWAKQNGKKNESLEKLSPMNVLKQVVLSKSVVLLAGSVVVGWLTGKTGAEQVSFFYKDIFMGMLSLFMLEMGIIAADKLSDLKKAGMFIVLFGILLPPINALLGIATGMVIGLSLGGTTLLAVLAASSSYIVAPAAMRVSLPKANPALYLGASLGITLPFNLIAGIPIYYYIAEYFMSR